MLRVAAPSAVRGDQLHAEVVAAGIALGGHPVLSGDTLVFATLDESDRTVVEQVVADHSPRSSPTLPGQNPVLRVNGERRYDGGGSFHQGVFVEYFVGTDDDSPETSVALAAIPSTSPGSSMSLTSTDVGLGGVQATLKHQGDGTISEAVAFRARLNFDAGSAGNVVNYYGYQAREPRNRKGNGTIGANYAVYVENQSFADVNYGLYVEGASTYAVYVESGDTWLGGDLHLFGHRVELGDKDSGGPGYRALRVPND